VSSPYPEAGPARDRWILERRPRRNPLDPRRAYAALVEYEPAEKEAEETGGGTRAVAVATIFLTNRECPWKCLMCDLWKNTLEDSVPPGAIAEQIREALRVLPPARRIKLYNAGSFFDGRAVPPGEHSAIAELVAPFERVIVESHPALVGPAVWAFRDRIPGRLEVAMGLETVHPEVLPRLNKRMSLDLFRRAADLLAEKDVALRVFVLVGLPWVPAAEARAWTLRSVQYAFDCGASSVSIIPTRAGNGAMDELARAGAFEIPRLGLLEDCFGDAVSLRRGLVFADLWDLDAFSRCGDCFNARRERLAHMNLSQSVAPPVGCSHCGGA
jgi:archaeosine synthase beta-subunit